MLDNRNTPLTRTESDPTMPLDPQYDPPEMPANTGSIRAKDLKNKPAIIQPMYYDEEEGQDGKPWKFVSCNVWVLDRAGIETEATNVRISWTGPREAMRNRLGSLIACRPVENGNAVILEKLSGPAADIAAEIITQLETQPATQPAQQPVAAAAASGSGIF